MDPSIQVLGKPVQTTGQCHVVYVQEKSGKTRCNKNDYVNLAKSKQFATFEPALKFDASSYSSGRQTSAKERTLTFSLCTRKKQNKITQIILRTIGFL